VVAEAATQVVQLGGPAMRTAAVAVRLPVQASAVSHTMLDFAEPDRHGVLNVE